MNSKLFALSFWVLILAGLAHTARAQERLRLDEAIKLALENNYGIRIAKNTQAISANNATIGNAGILPTLTGNAATSGSVQNTNQTNSDGTKRVVDGARNSNSSAGVSLNWTIFDGMAMFAVNEQLKQLKKLDELATRAAILSTLSDVINGYYNLIRQQELMAATDTAMAISRLRLNTANNRYLIGKAAKLEVLTARVDLNTDTTNLMRQRDALMAAKIAFNVLLARDVNTKFIVDGPIKVDRTLQYDALQQDMATQNPDLQTAFINQRIASLREKEIKGARLPVLGITSGYNFTSSHSELGFARDSRGRGFNYGLTASINIFDGMRQSRNERNARIATQNAQLVVEQQKQTINAQLLTAYQTYKTNIELIRLEHKNRDAARQTLDITLAKFKLGSVTPVEFREAQQNYIDASVRHTDAQYQAKAGEIALKELAGKIEME